MAVTAYSGDNNLNCFIVNHSIDFRNTIPMTVSELIAELQKADPRGYVIVNYQDGGKEKTRSIHSVSNGVEIDLFGMKTEKAVMITLNYSSFIKRDEQ